MRASDYRALVAGVDALDLEEMGKRAVRDYLRKTAQALGVAGLKRMERVEFASDLLRRNVQRSVICARLMALYEVSKSQAHIDINQALQLSSKSHENWTTMADNNRG